MDSERRHELETNDLREFLDNFKDFWDKHGIRLLWAAIIVLGSITLYSWYGDWQEGKRQEAFTELSNANSAEAFSKVASAHASVHDEAMRRSADVALGQARASLIAGDSEAAQPLLAQAKAAYTALADRGATVEYQLTGHEGLAKAALMAQAWDQATSHYEQIIELAGETFTGHAARAQRALPQIDLLKNQIAFAEPKPEPVPTPDELPALPPLPPLPLPAPAE